MRYLCVILIFTSMCFSSSEKYTNSLINSNSPYLLQHAHNPVNWYSWSPKTLQKAKNEDKLLFLSIGYSTCHWCHVMAKESFENIVLAKKFNQNYVSIKVDREISSDLDIYYQNILTQIGTNQNGWPLSVILTPNLEVLYITTYIPPTYNYGREGLDTLLEKYVNIYKDKKKLKILLEKNEKKLLENNKLVEKDYRNIRELYMNDISNIYDLKFKGFFKQHKFPYATNLTLLYDIYDLNNDKRAKKMLYESLDAMAKGGIYDQVEGAFFRYSVGQDWIVPHFEKMLYTSAELIPLYVRAYGDTKKVFYKKIVEQSLGQIERRLSDGKLFYSASHADSNGKEGAYFVFDYDKAFLALQKNGFSENEAIKNLEYLDITSIGNFEDDLSNPHYNNNTKEDNIPKKLEKTLEILQRIRDTKKYPFIDKKIITSWNAMMIKAFLVSGKIDKKYTQKGLQYLDNLLKKLYRDKKLYHFSIDDKKISQKALLEDYSFLIDTLLYAYKMHYEKRYLHLAKELTQDAMDNFYKNKIWYLSEDKLNIKANFNDKYYTSALGQMFDNLITISNYYYDLSLLYKTKNMIKNYKNKILSNIVSHSSGIRVMIRLDRGDIILKANKKNLSKHREEINNIKYPFLYTKYEDAKGFLACDESVCFGYSNDYNVVEDIILKHINDKNELKK